MGLMSYLRNRAGLVIFVIGLAIIAFLLGDIINMGTPFWRSSQNEVGSVNGETIDHLSFKNQVDQTTAMYEQQMGGQKNPQFATYAVQQVWDQFITRNLLNSEIEKIGLQVGAEELNDLIFGNNPSMVIMQQFGQTGKVDLNMINAVREQAKLDPNVNAQWNALLENVKNERLSQKYSSLLNNTVYTTALEAEYDYNSKNKLANFKYVMLDYASVNDSQIKLTDADYKEYYDKNKNAFKNPEETRAVDYILFNSSPNAADSALILGGIQKLKTELVASTNDSAFVNINSETKYPVTFYSKGQVSPALDSVVFNVAPGTVVGPFLTQNVYEVAKVLEVKNSPDSVNASHIVLNPATEGGVDKALAKADSIKNLILKGESFAALAIEFSQDPNSKNNAGEIGTLTRGMAPELDATLFDGKTGDVKVLSTNMGVHIIKVNRQIGNSKIAKLAIVNKTIVSGKETIDAAFAKANKFFTAANKDNFEEIAKQQNLTILKNDRTTAMDNVFGAAEVPRDLVRWAFEGKAGEITDKVYESSDNFIVAKINKVDPKGLLPLESVKSVIEPVVKNLVKARMLKEKMNNALNGSNSIDQVAQKLGKNAQSVENVVLANPVIPGVALENAVVGTVFGLKKLNVPSKAIEGKQGVYAVQAIGFVNPKALVGEELANQQKQITQDKSQRSVNVILKALKDNSKIVDNRIKFY